MKKRIFGIILMVLGVALLAGAVGLSVYNYNEENTARENTRRFLPQVQQIIQERIEEKSESSSVSDEVIIQSSEDEAIPPQVHEPNASYVGDMLVEKIEEYDFVGFVTIPKLGLELPVMSETDMELMRIAPCRYSGSPKTDDLVIGAHNYQTHFGNINTLSQGDKVTFTDMEGNVWNYSVVTTEILLPADGDELQFSDYELTLYTCTYTGEERTVVRCELLK